MRSLISHFNHVIANYEGKVPLVHFLKNYFKLHPVLGSRDRKLISAMVYSWYRCSKAVGNDDWLKGVMTEWLNEKIWTSKSFIEWLKEVHPEALLDLMALFPFDFVLSDGIAKTEWLGSMLEQPELFIRIRKEKALLIQLLEKAGITYTFITGNCLALPNGAKIDSILPEDCYAVQDTSSQQTGTYFRPRKNELWYDCCSGAGGKSLLLKDLEPGVRLTVSDKRESIIHNLQQRFRLYKHDLPVAHVTDAASQALLDKALGTKKFDNIICDAPCSGSGTWARTPEQLYFFKSESLPEFASLQTNIAANVSRHLKPGGRLIYITCSVFRWENEMVVEAIANNSGLELISSQIINGIKNHADSMYLAEMISYQH